MTPIEILQTRFPSIYQAKYDESSVLYTMMSALSKIGEGRTSTIDRIYAMIGIDTTYDEDLEYRWGSVLSIYRRDGETYNEYRTRLKAAYPSLIGGTAEAIKYIVASYTGVMDKAIYDQYIKVYDSWEYDGSLEGIDTRYGNILCVIDTVINKDVINDKQAILENINLVKAAGTVAQVVFIHIDMSTYEKLANIPYLSLFESRYDELGK